MFTAWFLYYFCIPFQLLSSHANIFRSWPGAICQISVTWLPSTLKSDPTRFYDPLNMVFGLKLPRFRLPKVSDCLRKSPAYKLLRVLSLSRMLVEFSLTCISHHVLEKFLNLWYSYSYKMHWVYTFLLMPHLPIQNSKQNFLKIGFPEDERGWENYDLLYQISIKNMKRIWNIRLFIFCIIYNWFDIIYDGWTV